MGEKDAITKNYMQDKTVFADAFNFLLYNGEQVIKPDQLKEADTDELTLPYGDDGKTVTIERFRDVIKSAAVMKDENRAYVILGIENQTELHYAMPVRNMLYDSIQYDKQVKKKASEHDENNEKPKSSGEFLSGFYKTDKILPVITLTVYFGSDEWDAPRDLHSMLDADEETLKFVDNYHLHLIAPAEINEEDFSKFHSELKQVMKYIKHSANKKEFEKEVEENKDFENISKSTADLITAMTGYDIEIKENEGGKVNMCEAIRGIKEDAWTKGKKEGKAEGIVEGRDEGEMGAFLKMIGKGILTEEAAAEITGMKLEEFLEKAEKYKKENIK